MNRGLTHNLLIILLFLAGLSVLAVAILYPAFNPSLSLNIRLIVASLLIVDAAFYFLAAFGVYKKIKWLYYFAIFLLAANALAAIFDEIGLYDIAASATN